MKRLTEFIVEQINNNINEENNTTVPASKTFTFNLTDLEDTKETIEKLKNQDEQDGVTVTIDDKTVTIEITKEGIENVNDVKSILADFIKICNKSSHRASSEQYALKLAKLEKEMANIDEYAADIKNQEEAEEKAAEDTNKKEDEEKDKND